MGVRRRAQPDTPPHVRTEDTDTRSANVTPWTRSSAFSNGKLMAHVAAMYMYCETFFEKAARETSGRGADRMYQRCLKRAFDTVVSAVAMVFLCPVFLVIAGLIKVNSPGPVFFRGVRVGRQGREFRIVKFRTMVANADKIGGPSTPADDPRITRMGRFIRRFNLDELPQLLNVFKGEMSIVGPRPEVPQYVALFTEEEKQIVSVRPGITDWATLWIGNEGKILAGSADPERVYFEKLWPEKHRLQLEYVRRQSLWVDCQIMLKTLKVHLLDRFKSEAAMPGRGR